MVGNGKQTELLCGKVHCWFTASINPITHPSPMSKENCPHLFASSEWATAPGNNNYDICHLNGNIGCFWATDIMTHRDVFLARTILYEKHLQALYELVITVVVYILKGKTLWWGSWSQIKSVLSQFLLLAKLLQPIQTWLREIAEKMDTKWSPWEIMNKNLQNPNKQK